MSVVTARQRYAACKVADSLQLRCVDFKFGTWAQPQAWDHKNLSQVNAIQAKLQALTPKMPLKHRQQETKKKNTSRYSRGCAPRYSHWMPWVYCLVILDRLASWSACCARHLELQVCAASYCFFILILILILLLHKADTVSQLRSHRQRYSYLPW